MSDSTVNVHEAMRAALSRAEARIAHAIRGDLHLEGFTAQELSDLVDSEPTIIAIRDALKLASSSHDATHVALKRAADMLHAVAGDLKDGYSLDTLRGKYVMAVLGARDAAYAALKAAAAVVPFTKTDGAA
jgi:arginine/ornithine N-succinyltransferase beta subunit